MRSIAGAIFVYTATTAYYSRPALFLPGGRATLIDALIPIVEAIIGLALVFDDVYGWRRLRGSFKRAGSQPWPAGSVRQACHIVLATIWPEPCRRLASKSYLITGTLVGALVGWIAGQLMFGPEQTSRLTAAPGAALGLLTGVIVDAVARRRSLTNGQSACNSSPQPSSPHWDGD